MVQLAKYFSFPGLTLGPGTLAVLDIRAPAISSYAARHLTSSSAAVIFSPTLYLLTRTNKSRNYIDKDSYEVWLNGLNSGETGWFFCP